MAVKRIRWFLYEFSLRYTMNTLVVFTSIAAVSITTLSQNEPRTNAWLSELSNSLLWLHNDDSLQTLVRVTREARNDIKWNCCGHIEYNKEELDEFNQECSAEFRHGLYEKDYQCNRKNCIWKKIGIHDDKGIKEREFSEYMKSLYVEEKLKNHARRYGKDCAKYANNIEKEERMKNICTNEVFMALYCTIGHVALNCPEELKTSSTSCDSIMEYWKNAEIYA